MVTIRQARIQKRWNQTKLAVESGLSTVTISNMEQGKSVKPETLRLVCKALGLAESEVEGIKLYDPLDELGTRGVGRRELKRKQLA